MTYAKMRSLSEGKNFKIEWAITELFFHEVECDLCEKRFGRGIRIENVLNGNSLVINIDCANSMFWDISLLDVPGTKRRLHTISNSLKNAQLMDKCFDTGKTDENGNVLTFVDLYKQKHPEYFKEA